MAIGNRAKKPANRLKQAWQAGVPDHVVGVAWSADGRLLAVAAVSGPVHVFEAAGGKVQHALAGHGFGTAAVAFHPTQPVLATCGQDGKARLWDATAGTERTALDGGAAWVDHLAWSADGSILATAAGKKVRLWDFATGAMLREYAGHASTVADLAWRPKANTLAAAAYGAVSVYDPAAAEAVQTFKWRGAALRLAWSADGEMLAQGNQDASVRFWYADDGRELHMSGYPAKVTALSWDFSGRYLATDGGPAVCVWDCSGKGPEGSTPRMLEGHSAALTAVMWQRRGFLLASGDAAGRLVVWQPANRTPIVGGATFEGTDVSAVSWSPDDKLLAVGSGAGAVGVFQVV